MTTLIKVFPEYQCIIIKTFDNELYFGEFYKWLN
jgi:hypothetical protein